MKIKVNYNVFLYLLNSDKFNYSLGNEFTQIDIIMYT